MHWYGSESAESDRPGKTRIQDLNEQKRPMKKAGPLFESQPRTERRAAVVEERTGKFPFSARILGPIRSESAVSGVHQVLNGCNEGRMK